MKSISGWQNKDNGSNTTGFAGLPGGYRDDDGNFDGIGATGYWWSSSEGNTDNAWSRYLFTNSGYVFRSSSYKQNGFSVRCLRD